MKYPLTAAIMAAKPKPKPLPGYPIRAGLDAPTIWGGKKKPTKARLSL